MRQIVRQIAQKGSIFAGKMHSSICVEWATDDFDFSLR